MLEYREKNMKIKNIKLIAITSFAFVSTFPQAFADAQFSLIDNLSTSTGVVGEPYKQIINFTYTGTSTKLKATLRGNNTKNTGIDISQVYVPGDGTFKVEISGTPKVASNYKWNFALNDGSRNVTLIKPYILNISGLKFASTTLPDATKLFSEYSADIPFTYTGRKAPKFSFNFPVHFGRVDTDYKPGNKFVNIKFTPSRIGTYYFNIDATNEQNFNLGGAKLKLTIKNKTDNKKPVTTATTHTNSNTNSGFVVKVLPWHN